MPSAFRLPMALVLVLLALPAAAEPIGGAKLGVVLMHGKGGTPHRFVSSLATRLEEAGVLVAAPTMPWGKGRIYDRTVDEAMAEIDGHVEKLKAEGARRIVVMGHSLGGNATLAYAARHPEVNGIACLATGHFPEAFQGKLGGSVAKAKTMIDAGQGGEKASFDDLNVGPQPPAYTTAEIYYSWFAPDGPAAVLPNAARVAPAIPVLWVDGAQDNLLGNPITRRLKDILGSRPSFERIEVDAGHIDVPEAADRQVVEWLRKLP
ncbi:MAG: alpha/beta hydrolase [Magnetospirillum sp. WYHS-4]